MDSALLEGIADAIQIYGDEAMPLRTEKSPREIIVATLANLPDDVRHVLLSERSLLFFTGTVWGCAFQLFFPRSDTDQQIDGIFLASELWKSRISRKKAMSVVAHELGHVFLGHTRPDGADAAKQEREADDFAERWGFSRSYPEYKPAKQ